MKSIMQSALIVFVIGHLLFTGRCMKAADMKDYPITPVPFSTVRVNDSFWSPRIEINRKVTIPYDFKKCEETGRIDNFAKAGGLMAGEFRGIPFDDSDVYKVIEGASYSLANHPDPELEKYLGDLIAKIAAAQAPDGYLYTARRLFPPDKMPAMSGPARWSNEKDSHELYNAGHLYEAAVAHYQATGKRTLLDIALKNADLICDVFGPGKRREAPGHEEIEIGLVKLSRATGQGKYLRMAQFFIDERGRTDGRKPQGPGQQDHKPVLEQDEAVGHAVRAGYLYSGMTDVAALTGNADYVKAIDRLWENVVTKKLYLTGGIGARWDGESFGAAYELPNKTAYAETCAAIANALWNERMFLLHGGAEYADVLERIIYNGFLSGVSLNGDTFFYPNPLETDGAATFNHDAATRSPWFTCSCCPVNIARFIPSIAGWIYYAARGNEIYVNLFIGSRAGIKLSDQTVTLTQETRYPWDGLVTLTVTPERLAEFTLKVRVPGWAQGRPVPGDLYRYSDPTVEPVAWEINGISAALAPEKGYAVIKREWKKGDTVTVRMPMPVRRVIAHEAVKDNRGRVALERGPLVYCFEGADNGGHVLDIALPDDAKFTAEHRDDLLSGVTVLHGTALRIGRDDKGATVTNPALVTAIPYYAWSNRSPGEMAVWLPREQDHKR